MFLSLDHTEHDLLVQALKRVYDVMRLLDFAVTQKDIDQTKIVLNGHSGGGAVTLFTGVLDTRVAVGIPASYFCTFKASILSIRHCMCNVVPGIIQVGEMNDIASLFAPRPRLCIHGRDDDIFPVDATIAEFSRLQRFYRNLGVENRCQLHTGDFGHSLNADPIWLF